MARLTIRDIARLAGLSKSTVSLVLNNSPRVDPATRDKVLSVMAEHNYVPSAAATSLARGGSQFIGMIVPGLTWRMVASINYGVASAVERTRYEIILYTSTADRDYSGVVSRILDSSLASGILIVAHDQPVEPLVELYRKGTPVVLVDTLGLRADLPSVESDSRGGALTAVQHLLDLGHRRIACIEGPDRYPCCVERTDAYREALAAAGIPVDPDLIRPAGFHTGAAFKHAVELFGLDDRPTAVFTHNDQMAYAVLDAAAECGLRVPDDVSVVGFDDAIPSSHMRPPLTTIRNPFEEMGRRAAELLLDGLSDRSKPAVTHIRMPTDIVVRASTGPVPRVADGGPRKRIPRGRTPRGPKMIDAVYEAVPQDPSDP